ncbi:MAG: hypothetical protein LBC68_10465 [Prevotellaceae bacterium]|nr:hypothetical protein [Prevotellaceae bacterium]
MFNGKNNSVGNYRSVEKQKASYMSRGLLTVFLVSDSAPREKELCTPSAGR